MLRLAGKILLIERFGSQGVKALSGWMWRLGYSDNLEDLASADVRPRTLVEGGTEKRARLMGALDDINGRFVKWTAVTASQKFRGEWKLRSEMRSPAWTTCITDVPSVRAG